MLGKSIDDMWTKSWFTKEPIGTFLFAIYFLIINLSSVNVSYPMRIIQLYNTFTFICNYLLFYFYFLKYLYFVHFFLKKQIYINIDILKCYLKENNIIV